MCLNNYLFKGLPFVFLVFIFGCASSPTLNLREKDFNLKSKKIVWFQIPGFSESHLSLLKFSGNNPNHKLSFEQSHCFGKTWRYNLFKLRPTPYEGFMTQMTGRKSVKSNCSDFTKKPFWSYLNLKNDDVGIFERGTGEFSSEKIFTHCSDSETSLQKGIYYWFSNKKLENTSKRGFHFLEQRSFSKADVYFDKACNSKFCDSTLLGNVKSIFKRWSVGKKSYVYIIRDFNYLKAIRDKKILNLRNLLFELEEAYSFFLSQAKKEKEMLIIFSGAGPLDVEFPEKGKKWFQFEKSGRNVIFRRESLMSAVMATGASAENFCGIYNEAGVFKRLLFAMGFKKEPE